MRRSAPSTNAVVHVVQLGQLLNGSSSASLSLSPAAATTRFGAQASPFPTFHSVAGKASSRNRNVSSAERWEDEFLRSISGSVAEFGPKISRARFVRSPFDLANTTSQ